MEMCKKCGGYYPKQNETLSTSLSPCGCGIRDTYDIMKVIFGKESMKITKEAFFWTSDGYSKKQDKFLKALTNLIEEISDKNIYLSNSFKDNKETEDRIKNFYQDIEMYKKELKKYL